MCDLWNSLGPILTKDMSMTEYVPKNLSNKQDMLGKLVEEPNILEKNHDTSSEALVFLC